MRADGGGGVVVEVRQSDSGNFEVKDQGVFKKEEDENTFFFRLLMLTSHLWQYCWTFGLQSVHFLFGYTCPDTW